MAQWTGVAPVTGGSGISACGENWQTGYLQVSPLPTVTPSRDETKDLKVLVF